ncbi:RNA-directed DNA polymerase, eukaryota, reverse transcriptase zinc-binding domain protein [Tanacetum coccineum]
MKTLSIGGRFTLLKAVLGSMPIFHMSIYKVPINVLKSLESIRGRFFNGIEAGSRKASWVRWSKVLTPKDKGGLGVSSLYAINRGLMIKWLWRFHSQKSTLWSKVIKAIYGSDGGMDEGVSGGVRTCWSSIVNEIKVLKGRGIDMSEFIKLKIGDGVSTLFWDERWYDGGVLKHLFPRVYALESCKNATVSMKLNDPSFDTSFRRRARGGIEESQLNSLLQIVQSINLVQCADRFRWTLESDGEFSVASVRRVIDQQTFQDLNGKTRWVTCVPIKVNINAWKIKIDALPTRFNLSRRGMDIESIICPVCNTGVETTQHLFFKCSVIRQIVTKILSWWNVEYVEVNTYEEWALWLDSIRMQSNLKQIFEGVFYGLWWSMWRFRNKLLFEKKSPTKATIFDDLVSVLFYWCNFRCKAAFSWDDWLKNPYLVVV